MQLIPDDILAQYEDAIKKRAIPLAVTRTTGSDFGIILISEASIRFLIPNRNR